MAHNSIVRIAVLIGLGCSDKSCDSEREDGLSAMQMNRHATKRTSGDLQGASVIADEDLAGEAQLAGQKAMEKRAHTHKDALLQRASQSEEFKTLVGGVDSAVAGKAITSTLEQVVSGKGDHTTPNIIEDISSLGIVSEVYTYGAPATSKEPFTNPLTSDGCFPGLRSYTETVEVASHQIDAAAMFTPGMHAKISVATLRWGEDSLYKPCPEDTRSDWPLRGVGVLDNWDLHQIWNYVPRIGNITVNGSKAVSIEPFAKAQSFSKFAWATRPEGYGLKIHEYMPGWRLVAHEVYVQGLDEDPVLLAQKEDNLECAIAFTGTNSFQEMFTSMEIYYTGFCGFENFVHAGFRNELWTITKNLWPALRPKLSKCSRVTCVGHSLGGSLCEVFSACVNSQRNTDPDFQLLQWVKGQAELMPAI